MPFTVRVSQLLTVQDLADYLHLSGFSAADIPAAEAAVDEAVALVVQRLGFDPVTEKDVADADLVALHAVCKRVAAQHFRNPEQRQSFSGPDGLSYAGSPQIVGKLLTEADRVVLEIVSLRYDCGFGA